MAKKSKKTVVKSTFIDKAVENSLAALNAAHDSGEKAIAALSKTAKSLTLEGKRLNKKRTTLSRRVTATTAKLKKTGDAETRKLLKLAEKELAAIKKLATKSVASKSAISNELKSLKAHARRTKAYLLGLEKADKVLNKPKKKKRKKRAKKATAKA